MEEIRLLKVKLVLLIIDMVMKLMLWGAFAYLIITGTFSNFESALLILLALIHMKIGDNK